MAESRDLHAEHARLAAQIEADVGVERIADVYAQALLGAAEKDGAAMATLEQLDDLVHQVIDQSPQLEAILASALISPEEKEGILDRLLAGRILPLLLRFLKVLSRHGRLACFRLIHRRAHLLYERLCGRVRVQLTTAVPVDDAMAAQITEKLRAALGAEPVLSRQTDPDLIGGAVLRIGDTVHDGSLANQLRNLRQQISDRNAHEIQSRRDRFCPPAGN